MNAALLSSRASVRSCLFALLTILLVLCARVSCLAETTASSGATAITSLPYPITSPGTYYVAVDGLSVSNQTAITVSANNVTLDFNGHTLTDSSGLSSSSTAINVIGNNVSIINGQLTGFAYGVFTSGTNTRIENTAGIGITYIGIYSVAANTLVRGCRVLDTGGSTGVVDTSAYGIVATGNNLRVVDCDLLGFAPRPGGQVIGIAYGGENGQIVNNRVAQCNYGIYVSSATAKYRDNLCSACINIAYVGAGVDAGNNH